VGSICADVAIKASISRGENAGLEHKNYFTCSKQNCILVIDLQKTKKIKNKKLKQKSTNEKIKKASTRSYAQPSFWL
jgi:hypothetical protein